ncbi:EAL domain-containing protein [Shewanella sp. KX20019]|uniref:EAL domain-containing protein n=1 Tax=Shewanella sp. KX20019 TaxID=2803864 RepID=UPI001925711C|nr:EAL domain-containing protein [Shewanella sp. KX20019]QQX82416.1 EAL domain-containing protein [Shewanella sp. KX20019]
MQKWSELYSRLKSASPSLSEQLIQFDSAESPPALAIVQGYRFIAANQAALSYFETIEQKFINATPYDFSPRIQSSGRNSIEYGQQQLREASHGNIVAFNWLHLSQQGTELPTKVTLYPFNLDGNDVVLVQFMAMDRRGKRRPQSTNGFECLPKELMSITLEDSAEAVYITDENNHILAVNKAMCRICGYSAEHMLTKTPSELNLEAMLNDDIDPNPLRNKDNWQGEVCKYRSDGSKFPAWQSCRRIYADNSVYFVNLFSDISEKKRLEAKLTQQAMYDKLTGLPNRFHLIKILNKAIDNIRQHNSLIGALMFLDLNGFKNINDSFGHATGDKVLQLVAARLETCCLDDAEIARLGGDEFTLVLPKCKNKQEIEAFSDLVLSLFDAPFEIDGQKFYLSTSIGISLFPQQSYEANQLLSMADTAMYSAKKSPNHIRFYNAAIREAAEKKLVILNDLRHAQSLNQFSLVYQKIVDLETNNTIAVEALLRWKRSNGDILDAQEFIPLLEETGSMVSVGLWAIKQACAQMTQWHGLYNDQLKITVNISTSQLEHPDFVSMLTKVLQQTQLPADKLIIEIEESALIRKPTQMSAVLGELKQLNIGIAIDDFGAGLCSLSRLGSLPIDCLKIDSGFAQRLHEPQGKELCKAMVQLAHTLNISYIAEGIETKAQKELLLKMGKGYGQGYYFGWPATAEVFASESLSLLKKA